MIIIITAVKDEGMHGPAVCWAVGAGVYRVGARRHSRRKMQIPYCNRADFNSVSGPPNSAAESRGSKESDELCGVLRPTQGVRRILEKNSTKPQNPHQQPASLMAQKHSAPRTAMVCIHIFKKKLNPGLSSDNIIGAYNTEIRDPVLL